MFQCKPDENLINLFAGNNASNGLDDLKVQLALVQAACALAIEGITRATASEISMKAQQQYKVEVTPSFTGQIFSILGIRSVTTHGKSKFVLEESELENIRKELNSQIEKTLARLQQAIANFQRLPEKIASLQSEWRKIRSLRAREQELTRVIVADRQNPSKMDYLEAEYEKIRQRDERITFIKKEIASLEQKEKELTSLEEKKKEIQSRIANYEKKLRN